MRRIRFALAAAALIAAAFGCDLLSSATTFSIDTGWQQFTIDTAALGLTVPAGVTIPAVPCGTAPDPCTAAASTIKCSGGSYSCAVSCGTKKTCSITASAEIAAPIDISAQVKNNTQASALKKVTLQRVVLNTEANTLTFDTPTVDVFIGPSSATKTTDGGVVRFGTIPAIPKGTKLNAEIPTTAEGQAALATFVQNYQTPFKMLTKVSMGFSGGDPLPQGLITLKLKAYVEIEPLK